MFDLLDLFKITDNLDDINFDTKNHYKGHTYENLLRKLDYFKDVISVSLMPEFVKSYKEYLDLKQQQKLGQKLNEELKVSELHILKQTKFTWNDRCNAFEIKIDNENLDFDNFFNILKSQIISYKHPMNNGLSIWMDQKNKILLYDNKSKGNKEIKILDFPDMIKYKDFFKFEFNKFSCDKEEIIKSAKKLLKIYKALYSLKKGINHFYSNQLWCSFVIDILDDYINNIKNVFKINKYMGLGVYLDKDKIKNQISEKSIPFSLKVEINFLDLENNLIFIKPVDIIKVSNKNIYINKDEEINLELYEKIQEKGFSEEQSLTVNFLKWEKAIKEEGLNQESIFTDSSLSDKDKWNTLLAILKKLFYALDTKTELKKTLLFFDPSDEIKSLYEAYDLAIKTIFRGDEHTNRLIEKSLLKDLINKNELISTETLENQIQDIYKNNDSLGFLKENIISNNNKFDYFSLNINQRIFSLKVLNNFQNISTDNASNIIALNGPPGTGKTTVLQTVVASNLVKRTLKNQSPEIIFGCSATNQAKNNIIGGFKHNAIHDNTDVSIYQRWIKKFFSDKDKQAVDLDYGLSLEKKTAPIDLITELYNEKEKIESYYITSYLNSRKSIYSQTQIKAQELLGKIFSTTVFTYHLKNNNNLTEIVNELNICLAHLNKDLTILNECKYKKIEYFEEEIKKFKPTTHLFVDNEELLECQNKYNQLKEKSQKKELEIIENKKREIKKIVTRFNIKWNTFISSIKQILNNPLYNSFKEKHEELEAFITSVLNEEWVNEFDMVDVITELFLDVIENQNEKTLDNYSFEKINLKLNYTNFLSVKVLEEEIYNINKELNIIREKYEKLIEQKNYIEQNKEQISINFKLKTKLIKEISELKIQFEQISVNSVLRLNNVIEQITSNNLDNVLIELEDIFTTYIDNLFKPTMFHVSMRIQEGLFIKDFNKFGNQLPAKYFNQSFNKTKEKYEMCARITPIFVSTMHGLSRRIEYFNQKVKSGISFIDLLVIDEAGQVSPEVGAIGLLLASKALIVGDTYQIEPVYNVDKNFDFSLYKAKFDLPNLPLVDFEKNNWNCHGSSIMKVAQNYGLWNQYPELEKGLYLIEHNRCPIELIKFCDELVYKNNLKYTITSYYEDNNQAKYKDKIKDSLVKASYKLSRNQKIKTEKLYLENQKPWVLIGHDFECDGKITLNTKEINLILEWLDNNYDNLMKNANNKKIKDIIAIITPFKKQATKIRDIAKKYNFKSKINEIKSDLFDNYRHNENAIVIGTVHSLQGAEIPIVLFSNVYGSESNIQNPYIDRQPSIINVGVSRAKQSFFIFGNTKFFDKFYDKANKTGNWGATALLYKYLNNYK